MMASYSEIETCKIVMYHYVRPISNSKFPGIKGLETAGFIRQLNYFKKNYSFLTIQDILDVIYENKEIKANSIFLTFDDGLKDHYSIVFPILKEFNVQGAFFPIVKPIVEENVSDVHKIHFILASIENKKEVINEIFSLINEAKNELDLKSPDYYYDKFAIANKFDTSEVVFIKRLLQRELPYRLRTDMIHKLFLRFVTNDGKAFSRDLYLSMNEIKEMKENGMYFGSHGYSHKWLSFLSKNDLDLEIKQSKKFFRKMNGDENNMTMCYPYGDYNSEVILKLKKYGFAAAFTLGWKDATLKKSKAFTLLRYDTNDFPQ